MQSVLRKLAGQPSVTGDDPGCSSAATLFLPTPTYVATP